jgi:hypothetical protein
MMMMNSHHHISDSMSDMLEGLRGGGPSWIEQYMLELQELRQKQQKKRRKREGRRRTTE